MTEIPYGLAVRAVIRDDHGRCLLLRRSPASRRFPGQWEWPGGKVEHGEPFDVALHREVREETGLEISLLGVVGSCGFDLPEVHVAMLCLEAKVAGGTLRLSEEHDESAWVPAADVANLNLTVGLKEMAATYASARTSKGIPR
jgi:8-oxo-dGTP diphosphatase